MKKIKFILLTGLVIIICIFLSKSLSSIPIHRKNSIKTNEMNGEKIMRLKLNYDVQYQEIEGFGASGAWWAQDVGGWDNIEDIMELLYDSDKGIGLNIFRYNIGAGEPCRTEDSWRRTKTVEVSPGTYDLQRDKNAIAAMREAVKRGAQVIAFANSPPARLTISGRTSGNENGESNLPSNNEQAFANYLVDITELLLDEGIPVKYLSPINEPQWDWSEGQEGCHYEPEQIISLSRKVVLELQNRNLPVKISIPESGTWNDPKYTMTMYKRIMDDEILSKAIDHYAVHSYWSNIEDKKRVALYFDNLKNILPLHQTEWCEMENGIDMGMNAALTLAQTVHEDMTILSVSSWQHWLAVSKYDYRDGLIYVDLDTQKYRPAKRMWSLGNYSKFIKPGYRRIEAEFGSENMINNIFASAYTSPTENETVIVVINSLDEEFEFRIDGLKANQINIYITSEEYDCSLVDKISNIDAYNLPAKSVVSFVCSKN